jgi:thiamine biosynthesis protein ThiI
MKFIIKPFAEIMIKSKPVRKKTLRMLQKNIQIRLKKISANLIVNLFYDKLEVNIIDFTIERDFELSEIKKALSRIPGIETFIEVEFHETNDFDTIVVKVSETYIDQIKDKTFCVRAKRS